MVRILGLVIGFLLAGIGVTAAASASPEPTVSAATTSPPVTQPPSPSPGPASPAPADVGDSIDDLWVPSGGAYVRLHGVTGEVQASVAVPPQEHCEWAGRVGPVEGAVWLHSMGVPGTVGQMDQAMGRVADPDERFCIGRLDLEDGAMEVFRLDLEADTGLFINGATSLDGILWLSAALLGPEGGMVGGRNSWLYRLDPVDGSFEQSVRGVLDVAASDGQLYLVHDPRGRGFPKAARLDPAGGDPRPVDLGLRRTDSVHDVEAAGSLVVYSGLRGQGATTYVVDGTSGEVVASTRPMGRSGFSFRRPVVTPDGVFVTSLGLEGLGHAPLERNARLRVVGERCRPARRPDRPSCNLSIVGTTPGAIWLLRSTSDGEEFRSVYQRFDTTTQEVTAEVDVNELRPAQ